MLHRAGEDDVIVEPGRSDLGVKVLSLSRVDFAHHHEAHAQAGIEHLTKRVERLERALGVHDLPDKEQDLLICEPQLLS